MSSFNENFLGIHQLVVFNTLKFKVWISEKATHHCFFFLFCLEFYFRICRKTEGHLFINKLMQNCKCYINRLVNTCGGKWKITTTSVFEQADPKFRTSVVESLSTLPQQWNINKQIDINMCSKLVVFLLFTALASAGKFGLLFYIFIFMWFFLYWLSHLQLSSYEWFLNE